MYNFISNFHTHGRLTIAPFCNYHKDHHRLFHPPWAPNRRATRPEPNVRQTIYPVSIPPEADPEKGTTQVSWLEYLQEMGGVPVDDMEELEEWYNVARNAGPELHNFADWLHKGASLYDIGSSSMALAFVFGYLLVHAGVGNLTNIGINAWMFQQWVLPAPLKFGLRWSIAAGHATIYNAWHQFVLTDHGQRERPSDREGYWYRLTGLSGLKDRDLDSAHSVNATFNRLKRPGQESCPIHPEIPQLPFGRGEIVARLCRRLCPANFYIEDKVGTWVFAHRSLVSNPDADYFYIVQEMTRREFERHQYAQSRSIPRSLLDHHGGAIESAVSFVQMETNYAQEDRLRWAQRSRYQMRPTDQDITLDPAYTIMDELEYQHDYEPGDSDTPAGRARRREEAIERALQEEYSEYFASRPYVKAERTALRQRYQDWLSAPRSDVVADTSP